jgi:hypothetical protein
MFRRGIKGNGKEHKLFNALRTRKLTRCFIYATSGYAFFLYAML